ncbi:universal stress protein [Algoriphagus namhaensis]|uniref:Universal stress protein n=1 Tax=Algoriphagus namhaensis TaxID=915353 RepID=A0ABV8AVN3_9BACT
MKILVPIDFSQDAEKALEYAITLAQRKSGEIELIHVIELVYDFASQAALALDGMHQDANRILGELVTKYSGSGVEMSYAIKEGTASITAAKYAQEIDAKLIVMGTKGASGLMKFAMGSTTVSLLKESEVPVLVVPREANLTQIKGLTLALEFSDHEKKFVDWVVDISQNWDMELSFLHIQHSPSFKDELACFGLNAFLEKNFSGKNFKCITRKAESPSAGLNAYLEDQPNTILVVCHEHKNFWNQLTKRSESIDLAYTAKTPVLVLI